MTTKKSAYTLASVFIGTVIGAGFASGQEILQFFGTYGMKGILGVFIITILFMLLGMVVLNTVFTKRIKSFEEFSSMYFEKRFFNVINIVLIFLLFTSYTVMLSGGGAVAYENFNIPYKYGIIAMALVTFLVFLFGVKGIANVNKAIVPFLVFIILWVGLNVIYKNEFIFSNLHTSPLIDSNIFDNVNGVKYLIIKILSDFKWVLSACTYFAYNTIGATVVMSSLNPLIANKKAAKLGGLLGGIILGILALTIFLSLLVLHSSVIGLEVPMIKVASSLSNTWKNLYSLVLLLSMFTTAVANGYGCIAGLSNLTGINKSIISMIICIIAIPLATLGFKNLVTFVYPLFGYIGMLFILSIIFKKK